MTEVTVPSSPLHIKHTNPGLSLFSSQRRMRGDEDRRSTKPRVKPPIQLHAPSLPRQGVRAYRQKPPNRMLRILLGLQQSVLVGETLPSYFVGVLISVESPGEGVTSYIPNKGFSSLKESCTYSEHIIRPLNLVHNVSAVSDFPSQFRNDHFYHQTYARCDARNSDVIPGRRC